MPSDPANVTRLLKAWSQGDSAALDRLTPLVYEELRRLARSYMRRERQGQTLQATALVNEAFIRLVDARSVNWQDRTHFFAVSARIMRRVLVDAARAKAALKRGGHVAHVDHSTAFDLDRFPSAPAEVVRQLCALDDALITLAKMDPRRVHVVELRYFGGLSVDETAEVLKVSPQTVLRDWKLARAWLARELSS
jgi:RNA polymerase sigma factor (TIGR02999 family)